MRFPVGLLLALILPAAVGAAPGDPDLDFGDGGRVVLPFSRIEDLALYPGNRVLVTGITVEFGPPPLGRPRTRTFVARYDADGALDPTFGDGGRTEIAAELPQTDSARLAVQPDGRVLVAAATFFDSDGTRALLVTRLDADGRLDPSFGEAGRKVVPSDDDRSFESLDLLPLPDGRFSVAALECDIVDCILALVRYDADGTEFGGTRTPEGLFDVVMGRVVLAHDENLLLGGDLSGPEDDVLALVRYTEFGEIDRGYPVNGRIETDLPTTPTRPPTLTIDGDDQPIAAGLRGSHIEVRRFLPNGAADALFAPTVIALAAADETEANAIALQPDGRVVLAGGVGTPVVTADWLLAILGPNGGLDPSFGDDGIVVVPTGGSFDTLTELAIQPDGRIVVAGTAAGTVVLARFEGSTRDCGDATGDGDLSVTDGVQVLRAAAGLGSSCLPDFCDTDASGVVTVTDGVRTLRAAAALPIDLRCIR